MSKEYLEAFESIMKIYGNTNSLEGTYNYFLIIKKALQRLEAIDNANLSEALECLEELGDIETDDIEGQDICLKDDKDFKDYYDTIKQALLKAQEQEKVLEIIKEYQVNVWLLKQCDYENYIRIRKEAVVSLGQIVNENGIILEDEITEEYFDLVKRWVE